MLLDLTNPAGRRRFRRSVAASSHQCLSFEVKAAVKVAGARAPPVPQQVAIQTCSSAGGKILVGAGCAFVGLAAGVGGGWLVGSGTSSAGRTLSCRRREARRPMLRPVRWC